MLTNAVLVFNPIQSSPQASYTLDSNPLQITQETKYLGVVIQSDLKFTTHIYAKISKAKLLAYVTLCGIRCCLGSQHR